MKPHRDSKVKNKNWAVYGSPLALVYGVSNITAGRGTIGRALRCDGGHWAPLLSNCIALGKPLRPSPAAS